jgi:hypothetical protein
MDFFPPILANFKQLGVKPKHFSEIDATKLNQAVIIGLEPSYTPFYRPTCLKFLVSKS